MTAKKPAVSTEQAALSISLCSDFKNLLDSGNFSDFVLKSSDGKEFKVHKSVLGARSKVFEEIFTSNSSKKAQTQAVNITDFDSKTIEHLLNYIYSHKAENIDDCARKLILAADKYGLDELKNICADNILKNLSIQKVVEVFLISEKINARKLFHRCIGIIEK